MREKKRQTVGTPQQGAEHAVSAQKSDALTDAALTAPPKRSETLLALLSSVMGGEGDAPLPLEGGAAAEQGPRPARGMSARGWAR